MNVNIFFSPGTKTYFKYLSYRSHHERDFT